MLADIYVLLLHPLLQVMQFIIIAGVVLSWLISFQVLNPHNPFVGRIWYALNTITEPLYRPLQRFIPPLGGMDFSPLILLLLINFLDRSVLPRLMGLI